MSELVRLDAAGVRELAKAITARVERTNARMKTRSGTVASIDSTGFNPIVGVVLDGDPPNVITPVVSVSGNTPSIDGRVTVIFTPPRGAIVIGTEGGSGPT